MAPQLRALECPLLQPRDRSSSDEQTSAYKVLPSCSGSPSIVFLEKEEEKEDVEHTIQPKTEMEAQVPENNENEKETALVPLPVIDEVLKENPEKVKVPHIENVAKEIACPSNSKQNEAGTSVQDPPSQSQPQVSETNVDSVVYGDEYLSIE